RRALLAGHYLPEVGRRFVVDPLQDREHAQEGGVPLALEIAAEFFPRHSFQRRQVDDLRSQQVESGQSHATPRGGGALRRPKEEPAAGGAAGGEGRGSASNALAALTSSADNLGKVAPTFFTDFEPCRPR